MLGAVAGDIVGSIYEHANHRSREFPLFGAGCTFTDDTVCTLAVADALVSERSFADALQHHTRTHPERGYGGMFRRWMMTANPAPYGSWGNGAAMRVSPVAWAARDLDEALEWAAASAAVTHDHPEAVAGAQAVALAMWMARSGGSAEDVRAAVEEHFGYDLSESVGSLRTWYGFDVSCRGTVPPALVCALEARSWEDAVRNAISIGGDSDTLACIAGGVAEAFHGLPAAVAETARRRLTPDLDAVVERFSRRTGYRPGVPRVPPGRAGRA